MHDWNAQRQALMQQLDTFGHLNPQALQGVMGLYEAQTQQAHLPAKVHSLIALAVAVTTRCDGCLAVHSSKALANGASREEIAEALGVAIALNAGAALVYSSRALAAVDQLPASGAP